jgi:NADH-ubiquinone oxidoreductase chain 2
MLLLGILTLVLAVPFASLHLVPILIHRLAFLILFSGVLLVINGFYILPISTGIGILGGLLKITISSQSFETFIFLVGSIILLLAPEGEKMKVFTKNKIVYLFTLFTKKKIKLIPTLHKITGKTPENQIKNQINLLALKDYPLITLFSVLGMSSLISSTDLVLMFLAIELQSLALYILASIYRNSEAATSAGLKYFLLGGLSSAIILLGSSLIYTYTGLTNFESLYMLTSTLAGNERSKYILIGELILTIGLLFKIAAAPLHNWAIDTYDGVPSVVTTWIAIMPKISIFIYLASNNFLIPREILIIVGCLSLIIGSLGSLAQYKFKRLLAYSSI